MTSVHSDAKLDATEVVLTLAHFRRRDDDDDDDVWTAPDEKIHTQRCWNFARTDAAALGNLAYWHR